MSAQLLVRNQASKWTEHLTLSMRRSSIDQSHDTTRCRSQSVPARIAVGLGIMRLLAGTAAALLKCGSGSGVEVALEHSGNLGSRDAGHSRQEA